jgi:hypothetical protein
MPLTRWHLHVTIYLQCLKSRFYGTMEQDMYFTEFEKHNQYLYKLY